MKAKKGARRTPEKPGRVAGRMAALRERRIAAGWHRSEFWVTDAEEESLRELLRLLRT